MEKGNFKNLGVPDLELAGLRLWVLDFDGYLLKVSAHCEAQNASVWTENENISIDAMAFFGRDCESLLKGSENKAELLSYDNIFSVTIKKTDSLGHFSLSVDISPDPNYQEHVFQFGIDQTYLPKLIQQCRLVEKSCKKQKG